MHLGIKIKVARMSKGLTQQELADKIHKTRPLISHIEQTGKVNYTTLTQISKVLGMSIDEMENMVNEPNQGYISNSTLEQYLQIIEQLKKENEMLKELVNSQKELLEIMKKKK